MGRHFRIPLRASCVRSISVREAGLSSLARFFAIIECKHVSKGAWIVRETDDLPSAYRGWKPIASSGLTQEIKGIEPDFLEDFATERVVSQGPRRWAFSVVEATDEPNDLAHNAIAQAVSGAIGWINQIRSLSMAVPVVVVDAPLYVLFHARGGDEPLEEIGWRRVLWGEVQEQTIVDVVNAAHIEDYGSELRSALDTAAQVAAIARVGKDRTR